MRVLNNSKQSLWALERTDCLASLAAFKNPRFHHYLHHNFHLHTEIDTQSTVSPTLLLSLTSRGCEGHNTAEANTQIPSPHTGAD